MGTIALAGISGYTGQRVLGLLPKQDVRLLLRPSTAAKAPWSGDARTVPVDLLDTDALTRVLEGVETIVCLVGTTRAQFAPARDGEHAVNYETVDIGIPRALATAGKRARARRFVLLSSAGVEGSPGAYPAAKRAAEGAVRESGLAWAILRPSFIVGPGREAARVLDVFSAPTRLFSRGYFDDVRSIHVDLLARAIVAAATSDAWDGRVLAGRDLRAMATS